MTYVSVGWKLANVVDFKKEFFNIFSNKKRMLL